MMATTRRQMKPTPHASESSLALSEAESAFNASCDVSLVSATSLGSSSSDVYGESVSLNDYTAAEDENSRIDDYALTELIRKLRGQTGNNVDESSSAKGKKEHKTGTDSPSIAATERVDGSGCMEDDLIEKHLKALASSTSAKPGKPKSRGRNLAQEETDDSESCYSEGGTNLLYYDGEDLSCDDGDDDDDESHASVDYDRAEHLIKQLGVTSEEGTKDNKRLLQSMVQSSTKFDYKGAPKTALTQRAWLTCLAKDLLREDSGSDEESSVGVTKFEKNISNLTVAAENAQQLIDSSTKQQEKLAKWRAKQRTKQPKFQARKPKQLLNASDIEAKFSQPSSTNSATAGIDRAVHAEAPSVSKLTDIDSVFTPVDKIFPEELSVYHNAPAMIPTFLQYIKPTAEIVVPIIPKKTRKTDLKVIVEAAKNERSRAKASTKDAGRSNPIDKRDSSRTATEAPKVPSAEAIVEKVDDIKEFSKQELVNSPSFDHSQREQEQQQPADPPKPLTPLVIPSGMPPYPGFGPKWPWHPYSLRAPPGYRECYMHHMGDCYFSYMEYLRTRTETADDDTVETKSEKILRHSLRQEAKFKKPKPALCPYTFTSRPGKARENCAVGGGGTGGGGGGISKMPKIDEVSSSSGSRASSEANSFEKKIQQKKTQPDVVAVGKFHPKAKGRKARIVVVSGAELDRQAKQQHKQKRQQQQQKKQPAEEKNNTTTATKMVETISNHSAKKDRSPPAAEQPHEPVESTCMCTIM